MVNIVQGQRVLRELAASEAVTKLSAAFSAAGEELALVGGPVRDAFLGKTSLDLDFTTSARPDQTIAIVKALTKTVWDIGRDFGTIGALIAGEKVEITTYRADSYQHGSRKPSVEFGDSLEEDLRRRDFTVNALALRLPQLELVDVGTGLADLAEGILRTPIEPEISFGDDPLRMMRAARFASQLNCEIEQHTRTAMTKQAAELENISQERIRDEFTKLMLTPSPRRGLEVLVDTGLAEQFLPELPLMKQAVDEHKRHKDVYEHSLTVLEQAIALEESRDFQPRPDLVVRLASLLHDTGKPATRKIQSDGTVTFYHHDAVGAKLMRKRLSALRFDKQQVEQVTALIFLHQRFFGYSEGSWTDSAVRRYVRDAGEQLERLHILTRADVTSRNARKVARLAAAYDDLEARIADLAALEELSALRPELDGREIMELLNLAPGPEVGKAYNWLLELRLDEGVLGNEEASRRLLEWWKNPQE